MIRYCGALFTVIVLIILSGCEKDDICVAGDTPLLIIRFYDQDASDATKSVSDLRIIGLGRNSTVNTFTDRSDLDSIALPLNIAASSSGFIFISDSGEENGNETGNRDTVYFNYEVREEFLSRACGYVARYDSLETNLAADTENWISEIEILQNTISDQSQAHVAIYH